MIYCPEIGKIYDTVFFCVEYFNEDAIRRDITDNFANNAFMKECYAKVKEKIPVLPPVLAPMFFYHDHVSAAMSTFLCEHIDYDRDTFDTFIIKIVENLDDLYSRVIDSVFPDNHYLDKCSTAPLITQGACIDALSDSEYTDSFKLQIALLFASFNRAVTILIEQLRIVYLQIDKLHQLYCDKLNEEAEQINSGKNSHLYKRLLDLDKSEEYFFTVSLLNQYITRTTTQDKTVSLLLGYRHEDDLHMQIDGNNINLSELLIAVGNETRLAILQTFMGNDELTATSVSKILNLPPTTALRHILNLYDCGVLYVSRRSGLQIFYRINYDVLMGASNLINNNLARRIANEQTGDK